MRNRLPSLIMNQKNALADIKAPSLQHHEPEEIRSGKTETSQTWGDACVGAFKVMDKEVKLHDNIDHSTSGTTAVVVIRQVRYRFL